MKIGVFIGSGSHPGLEEHIRNIGKDIALKGHSLIVSNFREGLAKALIEGAESEGGEVISNWAPNLVIDNSDVLIAMPGGVDMLNDLILYLQLLEHGAETKPLAMYDVGMMMDHIRAHLLFMEKMGFLKAHYLYSRNINDIMDRLAEMVYEDIEVDEDIACLEGDIPV